MILPDDHDQLFILAGSQANFTLKDAFFAALATSIPLIGHT
jgi:hypothetical protein